MRTIIIMAALAACDTASGRPAAPFTPFHVPEDSTTTTTGAAERFDLPHHNGADMGSDDATTTTGTTGEPEAPTTGGTTTTGEAEATGGTTTTGEANTTTTTGGETTGEDMTTTTGEDPPPPKCGDGVCADAEIAGGCYVQGWCPGDCAAHPTCITPCPCAAEGAEVSNVCGLDLGACEAVTPGGYCDPDGDGDRADGDWNRGSQEWAAKCG